MIITIGVLAGGIAGFFYWKFVGCITGNCAITSVWYKSTLIWDDNGWYDI